MADRPEEDTLYDAVYAKDRIGVGEKTLYRLINEYKLLEVHSYINGRRR